MKLTKNTITTAIAFTCLLSGSAIAEQRSKQEKTNEVVGLSSGLIIGTAIAGPLGGIIAGVFGVMIADDVNTDKRLETAQHSLEKKGPRTLCDAAKLPTSKRTLHGANCFHG
ncbi:hypothetical protein [Paraglaciecola arctica]|uniref:hypothetical protein n=1 Tax=Paraglaciecola arctica TaxID=1128911 RepID=UPI0002D53466|nr:hypothetical protein [Paraglaciecola arctica]